MKGYMQPLFCSLYEISNGAITDARYLHCIECIAGIEHSYSMILPYMR